MSATLKPSEKRGKIRSKAYRINAVVGVAIMLFFGFLPPIAPITDLGMKVLGVFIGMIYLFSTCEVNWPAILAIVALPLTGYCSLNAAVTASFGHSVVFQSAMAYIVAGTLNHYGVTEYIARWMLSRPFLKGRPALFTVIYLLCPWFLGIFTGSIAIIILFWAIFYSIVEMVGYKKGDRYVSATIVGIIFAFVCGGGVAPIRSWQLSLAKLYAETVTPVPLGSHMLISIPLTVICIVLYVVVMKKLFRCDFSKLAKFDVSVLGNAAPMSPRQKVVFWVNTITFALVFVTSMLPPGAFRTMFDDKVGAAGLFALGAAVIAVIWLKGGESVIDFAEVSGKCIQWNVLLMIGATMAVSTAIVNEKTGFMAWIGQALAPMFDGKGAVFTILFATLATFILTNAASNIGVGTLMIPIVAPFISLTGANAYAIGTMMLIVVNFAMVLPGASAPAALVHSNNEWLSKGDCYKYSCAAMGIGLVMLFLGCLVSNVIL